MKPSFTFNDEDLAALFPAFIKTTAELDIIATGPSVARVFRDIGPGAKLTDLLVVDRPVGFFDPSHAAKSRSRVILRHRATGMVLRGMVVQEGGGYLFCLGHAPNSMAAMNVIGLVFLFPLCSHYKLDTRTRLSVLSQFVKTLHVLDMII